MAPENLGDVIAALRASKGWSQSELAKRAGVSRNCISMLEQSGISNSTLGTLIKIFEPFGMRVQVSFVPKEKK